jgi:glyoxylase I family protein
VYSHLRAKGIEVNEPKVAPYGMKQLYLCDPDGFGLCFQWEANR